MSDASEKKVPKWMQECPAGHGKLENGCGKLEDQLLCCPLQMLSASQMSTLIAFLIMLIISTINQVMQVKGSPDSNEAIFIVQSSVGVAIILIYYIFGAWELEQSYLLQLNALKFRLVRVIEWIIRVIILVGIATATLPLNIPGVSNMALSSVILILCCCIAFLIWDGVVSLGGGWSKIAKHFILKDIGGCVILSVCLLVRHLNLSVLWVSLSVVALLLYGACTLLVPNEILKRFITRLRNRDLQR